MAKIKGKWCFNEVLTLPENGLFAGPGDATFFVSNGKEYTCIYVYTEESQYPIVYGHGMTFPCGLNGEHTWINEAYRTIDFGETEWTVDDTFYEWFTANATKALETIADKLVAIAENERRVYEAGAKTEREQFWDRYLRTNNWSRAFAGYGFGFDNFYPPYDIKPVGNASQLFYAWEDKQGDSKGSLKQRLDECGVILDTSKATNLQSAFAYTRFTELPIIDCTGLEGASNGVFAYTYGALKTIEKIIVKEDTILTNWFHSTNPVNVTFEGVIGQDLDISYQNVKPSSSALSGDSIKNIIEHLSPTATGKKLTLSKTARTNAFTDTEWAALIAPKSNWTISLV